MEQDEDRFLNDETSSLPDIEDDVDTTESSNNSSVHSSGRSTPNKNENKYFSKEIKTLEKDLKDIVAKLLQNTLNLENGDNATQLFYELKPSENPNKPKKEETGYNLFTKGYYHSYKSENQHLDNKQMMTFMGNKWKELKGIYGENFDQRENETETQLGVRFFRYLQTTEDLVNREYRKVNPNKKEKTSKKSKVIKDVNVAPRKSKSTKEPKEKAPRKPRTSTKKQAKVEEKPVKPLIAKDLHMILKIHGQNQGQPVHIKKKSPVNEQEQPKHTKPSTDVKALVDKIKKNKEKEVDKLRDDFNSKLNIFRKMDKNGINNEVQRLKDIIHSKQNNGHLQGILLEMIVHLGEIEANPNKTPRPLHKFIKEGHSEPDKSPQHTRKLSKSQSDIEKSDIESILSDGGSKSDNDTKKKLPPNKHYIRINPRQPLFIPPFKKEFKKEIITDDLYRECLFGMIFTTNTKTFKSKLGDMKLERVIVQNSSPYHGTSTKYNPMLRAYGGLQEGNNGWFYMPNHTIEDCQIIFNNVINNGGQYYGRGAVRGKDEQLNYYPTGNPRLIKTVLAKYGVNETSTVLEPQAGTGALIEGCIAVGVLVEEIYACEINWCLHHLLSRKITSEHILCDNFLQLNANIVYERKIDVILSNPPFDSNNLFKEADFENHMIKTCELLVGSEIEMRAILIIPTGGMQLKTLKKVINSFNNIDTTLHIYVEKVDEPFFNNDFSGVGASAGVVIVSNYIIYNLEKENQ